MPMKRTIKKLAVVVLYLLILCFLLEAKTVLLFSPKHIGMFLLGCVLLCIPYLEKDMIGMSLSDGLSNGAGSSSSPAVSLPDITCTITNFFTEISRNSVKVRLRAFMEDQNVFEVF